MSKLSGIHFMTESSWSCINPISSLPSSQYSATEHPIPCTNNYAKRNGNLKSEAHSSVSVFNHFLIPVKSLAFVVSCGNEFHKQLYVIWQNAYFCSLWICHLIISFAVFWFLCYAKLWLIVLCSSSCCSWFHRDWWEEFYLQWHKVDTQYWTDVAQLKTEFTV